MAQDVETKRDDGIQLFEETPFRDGFNMKTIVGAIFVGVIMLPGAIYMGLVTGQSIAGAAQWVTIILFVEIAKRSFVKLTRQEIIILYGVCAGLVSAGAQVGSYVMLFGGPFGGAIWNQYLVQSPQAEGFGIAHLIPKWIVPPKGSPALVNRTFFDSAWIAPIMLLLIHSILIQVCTLSAGYFLYRTTNDIERLPFPMASVYAGGATALAETSSKTETWRWRVFSIGAMIGIVFGAVYLIIPTITGALLPKPLMLLPIPFIDLTAKIGTILPGASFGLWTDLAFVFAGFVLPFWVVLGTFIGAVTCDIILSPIFYRLGIYHTWKQGMSVVPTKISTSLDLWISVTIGMAIVVAVIGIVGVVKAIANRRKESAQATAEREKRRNFLKGRGEFPMHLALAICALGIFGYIILCHKLVPLFPVWMLFFFGFVWTPLVSYISARMIGITGSLQGTSFPYVREGCFILSGYRGVDIWFAPVPLFNFGLGAQSFKQLELTRTKFISAVKSAFAVLLILFVCSFVYWSVIWKLAPIPSGAYPYVQKMWPLFSFNQCLWASSTVGEGKSFLLQAIKVKYILAGAGVASLLYAVITVVGLPTVLFYGLLGGASYWIHRAIPTMAGALLGRYWFERKFGTARWRAYAPVLLAGYSCGMGLIAMAAVAVALIAKAVSLIVF